jgi:hypothetical protein
VSAVFDQEPLDPFTHHLLENIDPKVRDSLTPHQLSAIVRAAQTNQPMHRHPVDLRGVIPFFFARYYFVLVMGRDQRSAARRIEKHRWGWASLCIWTISLLLVSTPFIILVLVLLYFLKSALGIDLIPGRHVTDLFKVL